MMTEEINVIHAQRWWRLRDSLRAASIPPSLDGARRRPPVPPLCAGDLAAVAERLLESGPTADRLAGGRRCWPLSSGTGALRMALLALSDQPPPRL
jgi:hypothetical protein